MSDPLDKATSQAPPTLGEGCVRRYDPNALSEDDGTEFADAAELWRRLQEQTPPKAEDARPHPALRATLIHRYVVNAGLPPGAGAASQGEKDSKEGVAARRSR